jgi:coenzyme F420-0:L-glutamate ligase/coenzyme F420-1:gamma-L-glutamate ligase
LRYETLIAMSDFLEVIKQRRSIRKYKKDPIPQEVIHRILEAAVYAPSAHNAQPWRFIVVTDQGQKEGLADAMANVWLAELERDHIPKNVVQKALEASIRRFTSAPLLVLCCFTMDDMDTYPDVERQRNERDLAVQSLAASIQNLLLAAHSKGLGACWFCAPAFCKTAVRQTLKIPCSVEPQALITLGYPAEKPVSPERYPSDTVAFFNSWGIPL